MNTLLGAPTVSDGMTDEQKKKAMEFINKEEPSILKKAGTEFGKGVGRAADKAESLLSSKESSKTISKKQNQMERPPAKKPLESDTGRSEYVTKLETPEQVEAFTKEAKTDIDNSAKDEGSWIDALTDLGFAKDAAKDVWGSLKSTGDRVDWLTTLTVYAASRYMGNNGGLALANGLMRGMESKSKQNQLLQAAEAGAAKAAQDQANKEREFGIDEFNANTGRMNANTTLLNAQNKGAKGFEQLTSEDQKVVSALAESRDYDLAATQEAAAQLKAAGQPLTAGNLDNKVKEMRDQGLLKNPWGGTAASFN